MTRTLFKTFVAILFLFGMGTLYAQNTLEEAINIAARYIVRTSPDDSVLAIVSIKSDSARLTDYVIMGIEDNIVNNRAGGRKGLTIVDRQQLDAIRREINFQYSGEVSEDTMVRIGRMIGAQIIVTGSFMDAGNVYDFNIRLLDVETAKILGSNRSRVVHDDMMNGFLPNSSVAQAKRNQARQEQQQQAQKKQAVKNTLGFFSDGIYVGYYGSFSTPFGISFGSISEGFSMFIDTQIGPPKYKDYSHLNSPTFKTNSQLPNGYSPASVDEETAFKWDLLAGFNIRIIKTFLWANVGAGFEYKQEHKLFNNGTKDVWLKNGDENGNFKFAVSAGLYLKIWYFYVQGKYMYVFGEDLDTSKLGLNHLSAGVGFVFRRN